MYFLGFAPCFIILSISVEGLFFATYSAVLLGWVVSEKVMKYPAVLHEPLEVTQFVKEGRNSGGSNTGYIFHVEDIRLALAVWFFVHLGFFGTGKCVFLLLCNGSPCIDVLSI
jgi:phosphatidylinositol glycan class N